MRISERLPMVMATIYHRVAEEVFDAINDDDAAQEARDFRKEWRELERQCSELCQLMPHNSDKYGLQFSEQLRDIEVRVCRKLDEFPWNFIHEHFHECSL